MSAILASSASASSGDREVASLRVPPHSIEAEQSVLGGLLLDNQAFDRVADLLREDDFYRYDHRLIWQQIARLIERSQPADVVTVLRVAEDARQGRRGRRPAVPERARAGDAVGGQHPPLRRDRPGSRDPARS